MLDSAQLVGFAATADAVRARAFYESTLGLQMMAEDPYGMVFDANGTTLRIAKVKAVAPPPYTSLGWSVDDIEGVVRELTKRGVTFERYEGMSQDDLGIWSFGAARIAWFKDPDGNLLSVSDE